MFTFYSLNVHKVPCFNFFRVIERYPRNKRGVTPSLQTTTTEEIYTYINKCLGLWCHCFVLQSFFGNFLDSSFSDSWTPSTDSWISSSTNSWVASAHEPSTLLQNGRPHAAVKCEQPLASVLCRTVPHLIYSILDRFLWLHQNRSNIEHFHSRDWNLWNVIDTKKIIYLRKTSSSTGLAWYINMAAVSFFWSTNMAAVTCDAVTCENPL